MKQNHILLVGDIQAFIQYATSIYSQPISANSQIANIIQSTVASAERVFELLDEEELMPEAKDERITILTERTSVEFEHVNFGYRRRSTVN